MLWQFSRKLNTTAMFGNDESPGPHPSPRSEAAWLFPLKKQNPAMGLVKCRSEVPRHFLVRFYFISEVLVSNCLSSHNWHRRFFRDAACYPRVCCNGFAKRQLPDSGHGKEKAVSSINRTISTIAQGIFQTRDKRGVKSCSVSLTRSFLSFHSIREQDPADRSSPGSRPCSGR